MEARSQLRHRPTLRRDGARNSDALSILSHPRGLVKPGPLLTPQVVAGYNAANYLHVRSPMGLIAGEKLGPYEIVAPLGEGGMGEVYRAHDSRLDRSVAIKVISLAASDAGRLRRFEQEARSIAALSHPNILAIFDVGTHDDTPYLVTELLEGETLRERLAKGPLPVRKAVQIGSHIAHALAAAHERGIVHRDLKPENIFLTKDGHTKLLDFGLAKIEAAASGAGPESVTRLTAATQPGVVMGTVGYMSPEQVRGDVADHRSDIFSFGAVLYEMLGGKRAFTGDSSVETMTAILKSEPPEISPEAKIPPGLDRIVRHCLEKNPDDRFQSARDLTFALGALSGSETLRPLSCSPSAAPRPQAALDDSQVSPCWRWRRLPTSPRRPTADSRHAWSSAFRYQAR